MVDEKTFLSAVDIPVCVCRHLSAVDILVVCLWTFECLDILVCVCQTFNERQLLKPLQNL